jgi:acyl-CoA synthetase (AMP-forming)/AMP-acid ligase II
VALALSLDDMFADPAIARVRRDLAARWRAEGYTRGCTVAEQARAAASTSGGTRLVFTSAERPSSLALRDLWTRASALAGALLARGVVAGDVVAVQVPNWAEAAIAYVAAAAVGAVTLPIVHTYGPADTNWILERVAPRVYVVAGAWGGVDYVARLDAMPAVHDVEHVVVVGDHAPARATTWDTLEAGADRGGMFTPAEGGGDGPFLVTFTSGTTSEPKGVVHSHDSFLAELRSMPSPARSPVPIRALQPWPAGHIGGMTAIMGPIVHGYDTFLVDRWDTESVVDVIRREDIGAASGVPTALLRVMDFLEAEGIDLPLRELSTGGAGIPSTLIERGARLGWHIGRCYGSSEHPSATFCVRDDSPAHRLFSDGSPMAGTEVRIVRDDGSACAVGEAGEIALLGPEQFLGYTDPRTNRDAITADGWLLTGDVGVLDDEGFLTVTDRKKDLVIRGGENISSVEVEEILMRHPAIAEAVVVAGPDPEYGERVCAFVVARSGALLGLDDVGAHFAALGVQRQKTPEVLHVVDEAELPRTPSGKVRKAELRERVRHVARDAEVPR